MKHLISTKFLATVALALGTIAAVSTAHAGSDVYFSVGVQVPGLYLQSVPVYVQPRPVYVPAPVHYGRIDDGRHHDGQPWQHRGFYNDHGRNGSVTAYESGGQRNQWRQAPLHGPYGDLDRDGIMNYQDRDRDGVRNRYDRLPDNPYRR